jgi:hypothetical protein
MQNIATSVSTSSIDGDLLFCWVHSLVRTRAASRSSCIRLNRRPPERPVLQPFPQQNQAGAVPGQEFQAFASCLTLIEVHQFFRSELGFALDFAKCKVREQSLITVCLKLKESNY